MVICKTRAQFDWANGQSFEHCEERWKKHIKTGPVRLLSLMEILNANVPHDWRPARFSSDFLVEDLETGAVLVGNQYRKRPEEYSCKTLGLNGDEIDKYIYTVLPHGSVAKEKIERPDYNWAQSSRPNLFIYDGQIWARQYEKVRQVPIEENDSQYFRLHTLSKEGLSYDHMWLRWVSKPDRGFAPFSWIINEVQIPKNYHGEDFFRLPVR